MKPMFALISVGVVLLLVMFYFGKTSFEGTFENNVYSQANKYNETAKDILKVEKLIKNVQLSGNGTKTVLTFNMNTDDMPYQSLSVVKIDAVVPSKNGSVKMQQKDDNVYFIDKTLDKGFYTLIFHVNADDKILKVNKTTYFE